MIHPVIITLPDQIADLDAAVKKDAMRRMAREALCHSASFSGVTFDVPVKDRNGVPLVVNGLHWSVSYTTGLVAAVVAPDPVGIDLEQITPVSLVLRKRVATEQEWALAPEFSPELFFHYWTAKEAVLKATGHGLRGLDDCKISSIGGDQSLRLNYQKRFWRVSHYQGKDKARKGRHGYIAAVTWQSHDLRWHCLTAQ